MVIWGASGHARVVADIVQTQGVCDIAGFIDDVDPAHKGSPFMGSSVLGGREQFPRLLQTGVDKAIVAIGDCAIRIRLADDLRQAGFSLVTAIHPSATIAPDVMIGAGSVVSAGAVLNPGARVGENAIINTSSSVDHDAVVEDGAHVSPGARLAGGVVVGRGSWIGMGACVKEGVKIGRNVVVGAGAVVLDDLPDRVLAWGVPARVVKSNATQ